MIGSRYRIFVIFLRTCTCSASPVHLRIAKPGGGSVAAAALGGVQMARRHLSNRKAGVWSGAMRDRGTRIPACSIMFGGLSGGQCQ
jgi:hypothetical protein